MNEVRLTIFIIGALVLLGIWLHWRWLDAPDARTRRRARRDARSAVAAPRSPPSPARGQPRQEPALDEFPDAPEDNIRSEPELDEFPDAPEDNIRSEPELDELPEFADEYRREPSLDEASLDDLDADDECLPVLEDVAASGELPAGVHAPENGDDSDEESGADESPSPEESGDEFILILHVMAAEGEFINGRDIDRVLESLGLEFSDQGIYHYHALPAEGGQPVPVFSVANMLEPGTFDTARLDEIATPGLALFAALPSELPGPRVFEQMLALARDMADQLEGEVLNGRRQVLTSEVIDRIESRVRAL